VKLVLVIVFAAACGAQRVKVDPVTVGPIHITVDVNVRDPAAPPRSDADRR
jgi:hypothetical protein